MRRSTQDENRGIEMARSWPRVILAGLAVPRREVCQTSIHPPAPYRARSPDRAPERQQLPPHEQHLAVYDALRAQLDPPLGSTMLPFDRMRRQRHDVEYPPTDSPALTPEDVREGPAESR
jgi:hypothetical protein